LYLISLRLCGFPPFFSKKEYQENENLLRDAPFWLFFNDNTDLLKQQIMQGKINFPDPFWSNVSDEAKEFVSKLLKVDPHDRLTAEQALQDTWIVKVCPTSCIIINSIREEQQRANQCP
jgi:serine/threonine protein kinase